MLFGVIKDWKMTVTKTCYTKQNNDVERGLLTDIILEKAGNVAMFMQATDDKTKNYLIGDYVTYPDFYLYELLQLCDFITKGKIFEDYPQFKEYSQRMESLPKTKAYMQKVRAG